MSDASHLEILLVLVWVLLFVAGGFNGIYLCVHGISRLDPYFSRLPDFRQESVSPFDRYSFLYTLGLNKPRVSLPLSIWLYFTCISLTVF